MMNIINGGAHADNPIDFQEFMIMPVGAPTLAEAVRMGTEVFHTLKKALKAAGHNTNVGDEGGFAPNLPSAEAALDFVMQSIEKAGYKPGDDLVLALDCAATEFFKGGVYDYEGEGQKRTAGPASRISREARRRLSDRLHRGRDGGGRLGGLESPDRPHRIEVPARRRRSLRDERDPPVGGHQARVANSILVKVNQIGSLTETLSAVEMAHRAGYTAVMSHRSGETEDSTIADLAVATNCGQIKTGSLARSDRLAKYNQLIRIEQELGAQPRYAGRAALKALR